MRNRFAVSAIFLLSSTFLFSQTLWDMKHLETVKENHDRPYFKRTYESLMREADRAYGSKPLSVTQNEEIPVSGDVHDYLSLAPYFWPNPDTADGLPYVRHDGRKNPEANSDDSGLMSRMASDVTDLVLAWYFSDEDKYALKAMECLETWFLKKETRMNPNLDFAQITRGHNGNKGRCYGVLEGYCFIRLLDAVALLENFKPFAKKESKQMRAWFTKYLYWLQHSENGKGEFNTKNNHSTAYDVQLIAVLNYLGKRDEARHMLETLPERRIFAQIMPDGSQPEELARTNAFGYSEYNLTHLIDLIYIGRKFGLRLDEAKSPDGRNFYKAVDFLLPYIGKNAKPWPYSQIGGMDKVSQSFANDLYRIYCINPDKKEYLRKYLETRVFNPNSSFNIFYYNPSASDDVYAFAEGQMDVAISAAVKAKKEKSNVLGGKVIPRTIKKDGTLGMVGPKDWCSGFFAGSLWQMYSYTNNQKWREMAVSFTWPIEEAKFHNGTHDLGFIINDSFGKAYAITSEKSYLDVILQASRTLSSRFNEKIGCIRSWDHGKWTFPVIIDNMMNLEMLFDATRFTGDKRFSKIAIKHAETTMRNHFREDFSSYHVIDYDPNTGSVIQKRTAQGFSDDSFWSRGQAWGLYGYTMTYRYTRDGKFLEQAEKIAEFLMGLANMPDDRIPYWDMKAPGTEKNDAEAQNSIERDASSSAIIASALYELSSYVDKDKSARYIERANAILDSLTSSYRAGDGESYGFLLLHSVGSKPGNSEVDVPLNYADYYYLEAAARRASIENR